MSSEVASSDLSRNSLPKLLPGLILEKGLPKLLRVPVRHPLGVPILDSHQSFSSLVGGRLSVVLLPWRQDIGVPQLTGDDCWSQDLPELLPNSWRSVLQSDDSGLTPWVTSVWV